LSLVKPRRRVALVILDGWGLNPRKEYNAIELGNTPAWHELIRKYPSTSLEASGEAVGQRPGLAGNSEVGHLNMGAGRLVWQDITRIDKAVQDGSFRRNAAFTSLPGTVHLMGLLSDGGVHSAEKHYLELVDMFRHRHVFHAFLDGRDTPNTSGSGYVRRLVERGGRIGTLMGRYWAMDRDGRWDRVGKAFRAIVHGEGERTARDPMGAVETAYRAGETDEFLKPCVIENVPSLRDGDSIVFFNFRADRARQLTQALTEDSFAGFPRRIRPAVRFVSMTRYHEAWTHLPCAFPPQPMDRLFGQVVSDHGLRQLRIAETEKYAHVTYFFNGGSDTPYPGEERILVPSPQVATYDLRPEMSSEELTDRATEALGSDRFDAMIMNYAGPDMVGHTGVLEAAVRAVESVDRGLDRLLKAARAKGWTLVITADHGNCEQMIDYDTGLPHTYHTSHPVPLVLAGDEFVGASLRKGESFSAVAPTLLELLGLEKPADMGGRSLLTP